MNSTQATTPNVHQHWDIAEGLPFFRMGDRAGVPFSSHNRSAVLGIGPLGRRVKAREPYDRRGKFRGAHRQVSSSLLAQVRDEADTLTHTLRSVGV